MIFRQKAMLRTAIRPKRKVVAGRTLRNGVARRGYRGVPVDDFRASFPLSGMTLSVVLGRTPWRAVRESYTDCREYMPLPPFVSPRPAEDVPAGCRSSGFGRRANLLKLYFNEFRPAGMHCEKSGKSDDTCASARSDRAKSEVFRDRSASAGVVTRYFSPCLIFWCFWIKPKAQKKLSD